MGAGADSTLIDRFTATWWLETVGFPWPVLGVVAVRFEVVRAGRLI